MRSAIRGRADWKSVMSSIGIACLIVTTFLLDTATRLEVAAAVFYVAAILLAVNRFSRTQVIGLAGFCVFLTLLSALLTLRGTSGAGLINTAISISAIVSTTYLALKMIAAETAAHEARAQLLRVARITSLGELTASIAHELNQPLAGLAASGNACLRWLSHRPPQLERARASAERIVTDAHRASDILRRVRAMARNKAPQRAPLDLNLAIVEALALAEAEIRRHGIVLQTSLADDLPAVQADRIQVQQVIFNLFLNSIEAMAGVRKSSRLLTVSSEVDGTGMIVASVADSGPGLQAEAQGRVFEAFWTTKHGGTGLGLTLSRSIVEAHGGRIWFTPNEGGGAAAHFALPVTAQ